MFFHLRLLTSARGQAISSIAIAQSSRSPSRRRALPSRNARRQEPPLKGGFRTTQSSLAVPRPNGGRTARTRFGRGAAEVYVHVGTVEEEEVAVQ